MCKFSWASTSGSEAQEVRDKLYCWGCGRLVCGPCSKGRRVLAEWGGRGERRVCTECSWRNEAGGSFLEERGEGDGTGDDDGGGGGGDDDNVDADANADQPGKAQRGRRRSIVQDLKDGLRLQTEGGGGGGGADDSDHQDNFLNED